MILNSESNSHCAILLCWTKNTNTNESLLKLKLLSWNEQRELATNVIGTHLLHVLGSGKIAINFFDIFSARNVFLVHILIALIYLFSCYAQEKIGQIYCSRKDNDCGKKKLYAKQFVHHNINHSKTYHINLKIHCKISENAKRFFRVVVLKKSPLFRLLYNYLFTTICFCVYFCVATMVLNLESRGREINRCFQILSNWISKPNRLP